MLINKLKKRFRKEDGSVTIEASIALTAFLFMFIMIYSIITICRAQAYIQIGINTTAKTISQYSYIYGMTGLDESLGKFSKNANDESEGVNNLITSVGTAFESIQSLGDSGASLNTSSINATINSWDKISGDLSAAGGDISAVKAQIEELASDPQSLLLGMAKLIGSESLELAKSKAIAEPITRTLIQNYLKRSNNDTAEAFCENVGILPGTYFGTTSYFNGIDFGDSTLFPYGTSDIMIVAKYKVRLLPLLPIDFEFNITQTAKTCGWLHGDASPSSLDSKAKIQSLSKDGKSIWNNATLDERVDLIRSMGVDDLKANGCKSVSGQSHIQAYDEATNSFYMVSSANPLYGLDSMEGLDRTKIKNDLKRLESQMKASTDNIKKINVKHKQDNGDLTTKTVDCVGEKKLVVVLVIPEDEALLKEYQKIVEELNSDVEFDIQQGYGSVFTAEKTEGED